MERAAALACELNDLYRKLGALLSSPVPPAPRLPCPLCPSTQLPQPKPAVHAHQQASLENRQQNKEELEQSRREEIENWQSDTHNYAEAGNGCAQIVQTDPTVLEHTAQVQTGSVPLKTTNQPEQNKSYKIDIAARQQTKCKSGCTCPPVPLRKIRPGPEPLSLSSTTLRTSEFRLPEDKAIDLGRRLRCSVLKPELSLCQQSKETVDGACSCKTAYLQKKKRSLTPSFTFNAYEYRFRTEQHQYEPYRCYAERMNQKRKQTQQELTQTVELVNDIRRKYLSRTPLGQRTQTARSPGKQPSPSASKIRNYLSNYPRKVNRDAPPRPKHHCDGCSA